MCTSMGGVFSSSHASIGEKVPHGDDWNLKKKAAEADLGTAPNLRNTRRHETLTKPRGKHNVAWVSRKGRRSDQGAPMGVLEIWWTNHCMKNGQIYRRKGRGREDDLLDAI